MVDLWLDALGYLEQGGWVMGPLALTSFIMWILIVERGWTYYALSGPDMAAQEAVAIFLGEAAPGAPRPAEDRRTKDRPARRRDGLRARLIGDFLDRRVGHPVIDREVLRQCALRLERKLQRSLATIRVLAVVAPLLGLLGTVLGMIETFQVIAVSGTGDARALSSGISVALVTTQVGLLVAVPGLFLGTYLRSKFATLATRLAENTALLDRTLVLSGASAGEERP